MFPHSSSKIAGYTNVDYVSFKIAQDIDIIRFMHETDYINKIATSFDKSFDSEGRALRTFAGERSVEPLRLKELRTRNDGRREVCAEYLGMFQVTGNK